MLERPPLSAATAAIRAHGGAGDPREQIHWVAQQGFRWITLDAAAPGLRPRELDRSSRRDLAGLLRRLELGFAGVDLWIPPQHFSDPLHADRAMAAVGEAIGLASDLSLLNGGRQIVSLALPRDLSSDSLDSVLASADARGVQVADHTWPPPERTGAETLGVGLDPAAVLLAGDNPAKAAARMGERLAIARLSDASEIGRVEPGRGQGRLNDLAYTVALSTAKYAGPVVLDLRGVSEPRAAAARVAHWWGGA